VPLESSSEAWKKMVLRALPRPAWLATDAPDHDVVVSSRYRIARNLHGERFPHHADPDALRAILNQVRQAAQTARLTLHSMGPLSEAERDYLLGAHFISVEFRHRNPGRAVLLDSDRVVSIMVNEEDHVRLQVLCAGWSMATAESTGRELIDQFGSHLRWMKDARLGFLTASPANCGDGFRRSALLHLIGLAETGRLKRMMKSLAALGLISRGVYGESSRAVGAFVQISATTGEPSDFHGAVQQLMREERLARREVRRLDLAEKTREAVHYAVTQRSISLRDALLVLGWVRWAGSSDLPGYTLEPRAVDEWMATMELFGTQDAQVAARHRADFLRQRLEPLGR
jgi:protein arginine kinase